MDDSSDHLSLTIHHNSVSGYEYAVYGVAHFKDDRTQISLVICNGRHSDCVKEQVSGGMGSTYSLAASHRARFCREFWQLQYFSSPHPHPLPIDLHAAFTTSSSTK